MSGRALSRYVRALGVTNFPEFVTVFRSNDPDVTAWYYSKKPKRRKGFATSIHVSVGRTMPEGNRM
jgi:hypothetical protein